MDVRIRPSPQHLHMGAQSTVITVWSHCVRDLIHICIHISDVCIQMCILIRLAAYANHSNVYTYPDARRYLYTFGTTQADLVYAFSFKRYKMSIHILSISNECVYTIHCSVTSRALILSTACAPRHPPHEMTPLCAIEPWLIWWWFLKETYMYMDNEIPA